MSSTTIEARTIDGIVYLSAPDLVRLLRGRATEVEQLATSMGTNLDDEDDYTKAVAYHTAAMELTERADHIDLAVIAHITTTPGNSPTSPHPT